MNALEQKLGIVGPERPLPRRAAGDYAAKALTQSSSDRVPTASAQAGREGSIARSHSDDIGPKVLSARDFLSNFKPVETIVDGLPMYGNALPWKKTALTPNLGLIDSTDDMRPGLGASGVENLKRFVADGGLLVTSEDTAEFAIDEGLAPGVSVTPAKSLRVVGSILGSGGGVVVCVVVCVVVVVVVVCVVICVTIVAGGAPTRAAVLPDFADVQAVWRVGRAADVHVAHRAVVAERARRGPLSRAEPRRGRQRRRQRRRPRRRQ